MKKRFYSNGKLLLTGEYVVLDGAKTLAIPSKFGQDLQIETIQEPELTWASFTNNKQCWLEVCFDLPNIRLKSAHFNSGKEGSSEDIAETLQTILQEAKKLNPNFLSENNGVLVKTHLSFPQNWGLGSSSTLINNIACWANVDPYHLLWNAFSGSGYDIACAANNHPIFYQLENKQPNIEQADFNPNFKEELFFIHLNKKQNSREGISHYKQNKGNLTTEINDISILSDEFSKAKSSKELSKVIEEHERIVSNILKQKTAKKKLFSDYFGSIKSLGAWGGDFIFATGNSDTKEYFNKKGFDTVLTYQEMIL